MILTGEWEITWSGIAWLVVTDWSVLIVMISDEGHTFSSVAVGLVSDSLSTWIFLECEPSFLSLLGAFLFLFTLTFILVVVGLDLTSSAKLIFCMQVNLESGGSVLFLMQVYELGNSLFGGSFTAMTSISESPLSSLAFFGGSFTAITSISESPLSSSESMLIVVNSSLVGIRSWSSLRVTVCFSAGLDTTGLGSATHDLQVRESVSGSMTTILWSFRSLEEELLLGVRVTFLDVSLDWKTNEFAD